MSHHPPTFTKIAEETPFQGHYALRVGTYDVEPYGGGDPIRMQREMIVVPPSVGVLLYDPAQDSVVLVEQFRAAAYEAGQPAWTLECVAGLVDDGETTEQAAIREVREESGCTVQKLIPVQAIMTSPGSSTDRVTLFCGLVDSAQRADIAGLDDETENIRVHTCTCTEAFQLLDQGRITNTITVVSLYWLRHHKDRLSLSIFTY